MEPVQIKFYTRRGCQLCDEAWELLEALAEELSLDLTAVDVDSDPALAARYGNDVPVAVAGERELFRHRTDATRLRRHLKSL